jgi:hypothetical protein
MHVAERGKRRVCQQGALALGVCEPAVDLCGAACRPHRARRRDEGNDGRDGNDGADGTSCHVRDNGDGTKLLYCDDGTEVIIHDGASAAHCGDGHVDTAAGELCDAGGLQTASCDLDCTLPVCGDQLVNTFAGEECDSGPDSPLCSACRLAPAAGQCLDPGTGVARVIEQPFVGDVRFSEWMANPTSVSDAAGEWIELQVFQDVDLNALTLGWQGGVPSTPLLPPGSNCSRVAAGTFLLLARNADSETNGQLPPVDLTLAFSLTNATGLLQLGVGNVVIDAVTWSSPAADGRSFQRDNDGSVCSYPGSIPYSENDENTQVDFGTPKGPSDLLCLH